MKANETVLAINLARTGDMNGVAVGEVASKTPLSEALSHFQVRHGLESHDVLDEKTVRAMNVPVEERIEQIEINMDRMRWIAHRFEPQHVRVNIPGFHLSVHEGDQVPLQMRAIVGSMESPTPVLGDEMEYLVFSPYWNIPISIAKKEFLPKIRKDPSYLRRQGIEVVRVSKDKVQVLNPSKVDWDKVEDEEYLLRQKPGTKNALGLVKFIFPNPYNVYLHDTPSGNLFDRLTRTLSHGCVRVERPADLAAYLLKDQPEWTTKRIDQAMHAEMEQRVPLKTKVPIHVIYWTAWGDSEGNAHFREDVYGYDQKHRELVTHAVNASLPAANPTAIEVDKVGTGIVPDPSALHRERSLSEK